MGTFTNPLIYLALLSSLLPLFTQSGRNLEFEYSFLAVLVLHVASIFILLSPKKVNTLKLNGVNSLLIPTITFAITPSLLFIFNICKCNPQDFIFWIFFNWLSCWCVFLCLLKIMQNIYQNYADRRSKILLLFCLVSIYLIEMIVLYMFPQKRILSFFLGWIHGPIYDQIIMINHPIIFLRLLQVLSLILLTLCISHQHFKNRFHYFIYLIILRLLLFIPAQIFYSTAHGINPLQKILSKKKSIAGLEIYFSQQLSSASIQSLELFVQEAQFHYKDLKSLLKLEHRPPIQIYLYDSEKQKKLLFGGENTDITDIHTPSIHTTLKEFPHSTIRHELVHALLSFNGFYGLGFHPNMAITEGIAVALAPIYSTFGPDEVAASMFYKKKEVAIEKIFSFSFWLAEPYSSYNIAGSFLSSLLDDYGVDSFKKLYAGGSFDEIYQQTFEDLVERWKQKLANQFDSERLDFISAEMQQLKPHTQELCPHSKILNQQGQHDFYIKLRKNTKYTSEMDYHLWLTELDPLNIDVQISLWRKQALEEAEQIPSIISKLSHALRSEKNRYRQIQLHKVLLDLSILTEDYAHANMQLAEIFQEFTNTQMHRSDWRMLKLKSYFLEKISNPSTKPWLIYLIGYGKFSIPINPQDWPEYYLTLRNAPRSLSNEQLLYLSKTQPPTNFKNDFQSEWHRLLAAELAQRGLYSNAVTQFKSMSSISEGTIKKFIETQIIFLESIQ